MVITLFFTRKNTPTTWDPTHVPHPHPYFHTVEGPGQKALILVIFYSIQSIAHPHTECTEKCPKVPISFHFLLKTRNFKLTRFIPKYINAHKEMVRAQTWSFQARKIFRCSVSASVNSQQGKQKKKLQSCLFSI